MPKFVNSAGIFIEITDEQPLLLNRKGTLFVRVDLPKGAERLLDWESRGFQPPEKPLLASELPKTGRHTNVIWNVLGRGLPLGPGAALAGLFGDRYHHRQGEILSRIKRMGWEVHKTPGGIHLFRRKLL